MNDEQAIFGNVRDTALAFVADLDAAKQATLAWRDEELARRLVFAAFDEALARLRETGLWGDTNRLPSSELWRVAGPLLSEGALLLHARMKPRGYAGDYEMLAKIIGNYLGKSQPGRVFDEYFQSRQAPRAVRSRTAIVASRGLFHWRARGGGPYRIVSVGSGPALDVGFMLAKVPRQERSLVQVTLIDLDPAALKFATDHLTRMACGEVRPVRENLFRLAGRPSKEALLAGADFSICTGFLDYLADADAARLLGVMWRGLNPGGELLAFQFSPANECRDYMEWIGNWYLTYRDMPQLRHLAEMAGIPAALCEFGAEETGSDLFVHSFNPEPTATVASPRNE